MTDESTILHDCWGLIILQQRSENIMGFIRISNTSSFYSYKKCCLVLKSDVYNRVHSTLVYVGVV